MKITTLGIAGALAFVGASNAWAEATISDKAQLVGTWTLEATAIRQDGKKTEESSEWEFSGDGKIATTSFYKFGGKLVGEGAQGKTNDTYEVKEGRLVTGRDGAFDVVEMQGGQMVLKNKGLFYFFKKK